MSDVLRKLTEKIDEIVESPRNKEIQKAWKPQEYIAKDHWHGIPFPSNKLTVIPFTVELEIPMWAKVLNFNVKEFYTDPRCYLENTLKMMVYRFEEFQDFTPVEKNVPIWLGATFESSLFGSKTIFVEDESPWIDREPIIKDHEDLERLEFPDFYKSGLMPLVHRMYNEINELVQGEYTVIFPEWGMGPFGVSCAMRGMQNLLADILLRPDFVHKLMRFVTEARKRWVEERAKFLGRKVEKGNLYDDAVNCPTLSPKQYEEFVLPYEKELCQFHWGIDYWHSCGNTMELLGLIRRIPKINMFHIGPWTDIRKSRKVFGKDTALEKCLMPVTDVQIASGAEIEAKLDEIKNALEGSSYTIRADGFHVMTSVEQEVTKIKRWVKIAQRKLLTTTSGR